MIQIKKIIGILIAFCLVLPATILPFSAEGDENVTKLPVLMYHHISTSPKSWGDYSISPAIFEGDLEYLRSHGYTTITLAQLLAYRRGECTLPEKAVMITFDDGQASFEAYALPLLEAYNMSAILAIVGRYADIYTETEDHHISYSYFSWPELAALQESPHVELAVHTYDMHSLDKRKGCKKMESESLSAYSSALNHDLEQVENRFIHYFGERPVSFAYPYGISCPEAQDILLQRGYTVLFSCEEQVNELTGPSEEPLILGRFNRPIRADRVQFFAKLGI